MKLPLIIAHRGASSDFPENTLAAFGKAIEIGADGLEFDVRITKNGVPIVFHDPTLKRIAGKNVRIVETNVEDLREIDAGSWFNQRFPRKQNAVFAAERIPTLQETLDFLGDYRGLLYLELKCINPEIKPLTEAVSKILRSSKLLPNIIVKSFKLPAILKVKELLPGVRTAALFAPQLTNILRKQTSLIEKAKNFRADEISLHFSLATHKVVEKALRENLQTIIWTADHPVWIKRAAETGIKAIITNNPARLLESRREFAEEFSDFF